MGPMGSALFAPPRDGPGQDMTKFTKIGSSIKIHKIHIIYMHHMTKFNIIISQVKKHHLLDNNITKFMDKEECKNFLVTMYKLSPHSFISMKFSSDCDHLFHEECGNSSTNIGQC
jgi:hypothetical protein